MERPDDLAPALSTFLSETVGISDVTSEVMAERLARFKTISGEDASNELELPIGRSRA